MLPADPRVLPLGSIVRIEGLDGQRQVHDVGGAVRGRHVDVFTSSCSEARAWGRQRCRCCTGRRATRLVGATGGAGTACASSRGRSARGRARYAGPRALRFVAGFGPGFTVPGSVRQPFDLHRAQAFGGSSPRASQECWQRVQTQAQTETVRRSRFATMGPRLPQGPATE